MPLDALDLVVLFACGYSLIQPRLLTDDFFSHFVGRAFILQRRGERRATINEELWGGLRSIAIH